MKWMCALSTWTRLGRCARNALQTNSFSQFFRWISERYPMINIKVGSLGNYSTSEIGAVGSAFVVLFVGPYLLTVSMMC
jgi:hypothetical protein